MSDRVLLVCGVVVDVVSELFAVVVFMVRINYF